jgi:hypothetical protein
VCEPFGASAQTAVSAVRSILMLASVVLGVFQQFGRAQF